MYKIGYLFASNHTDIHYVRQPNRVDFRRRYDGNFSTDERLAKPIQDIDTAKALIIKIVDRFTKNDGYQYTPVLINTQTGWYQRYLNGHWLHECIDTPERKKAAV